MPGKLNVYNLGDLGVHLVESPVHAPDGAFVSAQNAAVSQDQGEHGIRKRPGLAKLTGTALGGSILAIGNLPFQDPYGPLPDSGERAFVNEYNEGPTGSFVSTINGTTWAAPPASPGGWGASVYVTSYTQRGGVISSPGLITYLSSSFELHTFDGSTDSTIATGSLGSFSPQAGPALHNDVVYFAAADVSSGKLFRQDGSGFVEVVSGIGKPPIGIASALGRVYIATDENRIYYWSESTGLVLDVTLSPTGGDVFVTDIAHNQGVIYATCATKGVSTATTHKVLKRTGDTAWSDITPQAQGDYGPIAAFEDGLLYVVRKAHDAFTGCEILTYNGSSWSTDLDVTSIAPGATRVVSLVSFNGAMYATVTTATTRDIIRRASGTWTNVHSQSNSGSSNYYTAIGFY